MSATVFFYAGIQTAFFRRGGYSGRTDALECVVPAAGAFVSLRIWRRFGLSYAFLAAMLFVVWLPHYWTSSRPAQHLIVAAFYAAGLILVAALRPRYRFTFLDNEYAIAEALLWLGIYLTINLRWWDGWDLASQRTVTEFSKQFYWGTWAPIWCLPPAMLLRGLHRKDPFVVSAGAIAAVLTLVTNKPYLGWQPHSWDPMLLGALLIGTALAIRHWLSGGPGGVRHGFTAHRLSGKDKQWLDAGAAALGLLAPHAAGPTPGSGGQEVRFSGGDSGGGGASSDF